MKRKVFFILGALFSVLPPAIATLSYFPLWVKAGPTHTVSGLCALALVICATPLLRIAMRHLRTPSLPLFWTLAYLLLKCFSAVIVELCMIAFVGACSNIIGALFFHLSKKRPPTAGDQ